MILFVNPRATKPANRRFPLSIMAVGAALPAHLEWEIIDENLPDCDVLGEVAAYQAAGKRVDVIALTVMPGPQLVSAVRLSKALKRKFPGIPLVWGGNFGSLYPAPVLNAPYVDWLIKGQGEQTFVELLEVLDGKRDPAEVAGLCYRNEDGEHVIGKERVWVGPAELPDPRYDKINVADYLADSLLGKRTGVYQASIGCPFACSFCGVISVFGRKEKVQEPARMAEHLRCLIDEFGMDALHFYDNNFFLNEKHALKIVDALEPLGIKWWCESRVDTLSKFSDETWGRLKSAGLEMVFCGAESGSNEVLAKMQKGITTDQTEFVAAKAREFDIIPEFSFVFGDPDAPEREIENTISFIYKLKGINPDLEMITYHYTPTPQRDSTYGDVDPLSGTPTDLEDWTQPEWVDWMSHENPDLPWMSDQLRARVADFETVLRARFPSRNDRKTRAWGKLAGQWLARRRWERKAYSDPKLLRNVQKWSRKRPVSKQEYGHLRGEKLG